MHADPEVRKYLGPLLTAEQASAWALNFQDDLERYGFGFWALQVSSSGEFIGFTGLGTVGDEMPFAGTELAWRLARPSWGTDTPPRRPRPRCGTASTSWGWQRSWRFSGIRSTESIDFVPDAIFEEPRLAQIYDPLDPDRSDLDAYVGLAEEFGARSVLDIGCGTGTFACLLARRGLQVVAVDPAGASLDVARAKPGADLVRWVPGDATTLPPPQVDLATMTANVAQVFLTDEDWASTLRATYAALRPGGRLVFETRDPRRKAWLTWHREQSYTRTDIPEVGAVEDWVEVTAIRGELVSFRSTCVFEKDGAILTSDSTLRFREHDEIADSLLAARFTVEEVRDAPGRPGLELVFVARRPNV